MPRRVFHVDAHASPEEHARHVQIVVAHGLAKGLSALVVPLGRRGMVAEDFVHLVGEAILGVVDELRGRGYDFLLLVTPTAKYLAH